MRDRADSVLVSDRLAFAEAQLGGPGKTSRGTLEYGKARRGINEYPQSEKLNNLKNVV